MVKVTAVVFCLSDIPRSEIHYPESLVQSSANADRDCVS